MVLTLSEFKACKQLGCKLSIKQPETTANGLNTSGPGTMRISVLQEDWM